MCTFQGFRAKARPNFALLSTALVSTSPERVKKDFGRHSCWITALAFPKLFTRALTVVNGSNECWVPTKIVFSLVEKTRFTSAPTNVLVRGLTTW
ncbi:hypothetical protein Hanom_Chr07g00649101 [Helianthus anomalus]